MITIEGKSVFGGVSIGKLMFYKRNEKVIRRTHVDDVDAEWKRFEEAKNTAIDQLKVLYDKAIEDVGEANAMIFEIHQMMLDDLDYLESIEGIIRTQSVNAEYAVSTTADNFAQMFASMDDAYMQGRAADVKDVSERVLDILCGVSNGTREMTEPCIVAADDLAPSETVQLDKEKVLGFATMYGSSNSHTAILARTMNIPAVIGMGEALNPKYDGEMAIIDGFTGTIYVARDAAHKRMIEALQRGEELPIDIKDSTIYYMGPSPAREGRPIGSAGPTTATRMDRYAPTLLDLGEKAMIGKGKRSKEVIDAIVRNHAVYFAAVGGAGALLSKCITKSEIVCYEDLGAEAIRKIEIKDFPVIVVIDSQGDNLYETAVKEFAG